MEDAFLGGGNQTKADVPVTHTEGTRQAWGVHTKTTEGLRFRVGTPCTKTDTHNKHMR